ncbi:MAG: hypothetical protein GXO34_05415 [Deltaproteobacteria bacterium]|nr:hypothetical protein [Deltaproteobacteria bacterium]
MHTWHRLAVILALLGFLPLFQGCAGDRRVDDLSLTTCFHNYTEVYAERIYRVLKSAPGVNDIERSWSACRKAEGNCLCYRLEYDGHTEDLCAWLRRHLPVNKAIPFHCVYKGEHRLDVIFDAGFK